jgi:hypothetical protein
MRVLRGGGEQVKGPSGQALMVQKVEVLRLMLPVGAEGAASLGWKLQVRFLLNGLGGFKTSGLELRR